MAQLPTAFNPSAPGQVGVSERVVYEAGDYLAHITDSKMVKTKDETGEFLQLNWTFLAGEVVGKTWIQRLNLINPNPAAVEIANKHMKSICDCFGFATTISDSNVLHGIPCILSMYKQKAKPTATGNYGESNEVSKYTPAGGIAPGVAPAVPGVAPTIAAPAWGAAAALTPEVAVAPVAPIAAVPIAPAPVVAAPVVTGGFDPDTGLPIAPAPVAPTVGGFDSNTGLPIAPIVAPVAVAPVAVVAPGTVAAPVAPVVLSPPAVAPVAPAAPAAPTTKPPWKRT